MRQSLFVIQLDDIVDNSPWIRTVDGVISPLISTDNLDMSDGNYLINELPEL